MTVKFCVGKVLFSCRMTSAKIQLEAHSMSHLLLFHGKNDYANAPHYFMYIACLVLTFLVLSVFKQCYESAYFF